MILLFMRVDKKSNSAITTIEPINAPNTTGRKPDRVKDPAVIVPPAASITSATPKLEPEVIPKIEGPASGLLNAVCSSKPDTANAPPQRRAVKACGNRDSHTMNAQLLFSTSLPSKVFQTALAGILIAPKSRFPTNKAMISTSNKST